MVWVVAFAIFCADLCLLWISQTRCVDFPISSFLSHSNALSLEIFNKVVTKKSIRLFVCGSGTQPLTLCEMPQKTCWYSRLLVYGNMSSTVVTVYNS